MKINSEQEMLEFGESFAKNPPRVIELIGDVGAGKTTFVRGFAKGLGIKKNITSPSFTISKTYSLPNDKSLTHYDFYRLKNPGIIKEDLKEKIAEDGIIIVEWGNSIKNILPENRTIIKIELKDNHREVTIDNHENAIDQSPEIITVQKQNDKTSKKHINPIAINTNTNQNDILRLYLDTSTPITILKLNDKEYRWNSGRDLAENLLQFIYDKLQENNKSWQDITEIIFMSGPGSFTGLRIGAAIINALAHELNIPLRNHKGEVKTIIVPDYGRAANISQPRK